MSFFKRKSDKGSKLSPKVGRHITRKGSQNSCSSQELDSPEVPNGDLAHTGSSVTGVQYGGARPRTLLLRSDCEIDSEKGDLGTHSIGLKVQTPLHTSSRLSKTLYEILHDKDALPYFIQYIEARGAGHLIKFWLDAESFQASSWTRINTRSQAARSRTSPDLTDNAGNPSSPQQISDLDRPSRPLQFPPSLSSDAPLSSEPSQGKSSESCANYCDLVQSCSGHSGRHSLPQTGPDVSSVARCTVSTDEQPRSHEPATPPSHSEVTSKIPDRLQTSSQQPISDAKTDLENKISERVSPVSERTSPVSDSVKPVAGRDAPEPSSCSPNSGAADTRGASPSDTTHTADVAHKPGSKQVTRVTDEDTFQLKLRQSIEKDAVRIFTKYISPDATDPIGVNEQLRSEVVRKICQEDGHVDPQCFCSCQEYVAELFEKLYFQGFLLSEYHCKHQIDILTGSQVLLADILYNESAFFYFMEYMEQEGAMSLLQCFLELDSFQQHLSSQQGQYDGDQAQTDAMILYDKYFSLQATNPLGFEDKIRYTVESNICREGGPLADCFSSAKSIVVRTIEKCYFSGFLTSDLYFKFLSELINTVQTSQEFPQCRKRRGSDASSEHSLGSQSTGSEAAVGGRTKNTLLAVDSSVQGIKKALNKMDYDMRIDGMFFNPDALWKRPQSSKMSLGKIDELGRFISDFDPEPDHEKRSLSGTLFRKMKDHEKTQEDMALQIARMIVSEISTSTQSTQSPEGATEGIS